MNLSRYELCYDVMNMEAIFFLSVEIWHFKRRFIDCLKARFHINTLALNKRKKVEQLNNIKTRIKRMGTTVKGADGKLRCKWCDTAPEFLYYHDTEWGFPVSDDVRLFEKLCLEGFQSGLSWRTILAKRENFRSAFHNFDFEKVARFTQRDVTRLLKDEGIVRHRGKIEAVINNAKRAKELIKEEGSLAAFFWCYEPDEKKLGKPQSASTSAESIALSKDLKKRGWKFIGPTTAYAFIQAMGLINDHVHDCVIRTKVERARNRFKRP